MLLFLLSRRLIIQLDIAVFGAAISLVHALVKNPDTQWENNGGGGGGGYSSVGGGVGSANDTI